MGLFSRKKSDDKQKTDEKPEKVDSGAGSKKDEAQKTSMKDLYNKQNDKAKKHEGEKSSKKKHGNAYKILIKPLITEKASVLSAEGKYIFAVARNTNKIEAAKAIEEIYNIKPISVNIITKIGKKTRSGRTIGKRKDWKKAVITLPKGESIKVYEGV